MSFYTVGLIQYPPLGYCLLVMYLKFVEVEEGVLTVDQHVLQAVTMIAIRGCPPSDAPKANAAGLLRQIAGGWPRHIRI